MPDVILGRDMQTNQIISISDGERRSGLYILGRMGRGKTSLMTKLIEQDVTTPPRKRGGFLAALTGRVGV
jgi:Cdc6-like AAA superfamily ATPase